eukprot:11200508-Lingulodinium_polyedra.AAC.1
MGRARHAKHARPAGPRAIDGCLPLLKIAAQQWCVRSGCPELPGIGDGAQRAPPSFAEEAAR